MSVVPNAGKSPFAHLAGVIQNAKADNGDDDDEAKKAKKAEEEKKEDDEAKKAEEDKKKDDEAKAKKAEEDKKKEDDEDEAKAKSEGDDESDDKDDKKPDARTARAHERGRIKAILLSEPGKANPVAAAHLATGTSMSRSQAIEMLSAMQASAPATAATVSDKLRGRMANETIPAVGAGDVQGSPNLAQQIVAAGKKRRGEI
jgi:hypothetical protein